MTFLSEYEVVGVVEGYDWTAFKGRTVCDIGGNYGSTPRPTPFFLFFGFR